MKSDLIRFCLTFFVVLFGSCLRAELEFSGFSVSPTFQLFVVRDMEDDKSSGWLRMGQSFRGYTLKSFDKNREVITVQKDGRDLEIRLKQSKIKDGKLTVEGTVSVVGGEKIEGVRVSLFIGEESVIPLSESVRLAITPTRMADGNMKYAAKFITITEGKEVILASPTLVALPGQPFAIQVGEYGYKFVPQL
jgi:hypothetical protein